MRVPRPYAAALLVLATSLVAGCAAASSSGEASAVATATTTAPTIASPIQSDTPTPTPSAPTTPPSPTATATTAATPTPEPEPARLSVVPRAGAEPTVRFPVNEPAQGAGANATVSAIPDAAWKRMVGYSWTPGCPVGRSQLRWVRVNFWGFDGKRSRGSIVVNASIAQATARAFTRLYDIRFRIRQMKPMDSTWGKNPKGPGADDYAAMRADNTSAFNCRYVGGQEASKVYSKHASGTAIDVNDFENPYVADDGTVYPGTYWLHRRERAAGVFWGSSSRAVHAFTDQGLRWGGLWSHPDYQHFDR